MSASPALRHILMVALVAITAVPTITIAPRPAAAARGPLPTVIDTVIGTKIIGYSVAGRPIVAHRLGDPSSPVKAVLLGQIHGEEPAGVTVANALLRGAPVKGIDLWVIPTMNPDGHAVGRRQNDHGVDLNRNWSYDWARLTGTHYSGPAPFSEPETRAMRDFLISVNPRYVASIHQPLFGVDTTDGGARDPAFRRRLSVNLGLPEKAFMCWSVCRGTMTKWLTHNLTGAGIVVEYSASPTESALTQTAPRGFVAAFGGSYHTPAGPKPDRHLDHRLC